MSKARGEVIGTRELPAPFALFNTVPGTESLQPIMTAMVELNGKGQIGWLDCQREWTRFLSQRFEEDMKLVNRLTNCTTPQDVYGAYADFLQKATNDYQQEWAKLMKIGQTCASEVTSCAQQVVDVASNPAPSKTA